MKKLLLATSLVFGLLFLSADATHASYLVVNSKGELVWKVLSVETPSAEQPSEIKVKDVLNTRSYQNPKISLFKDGDRLQLLVASKEGEKKIDVTDFDQDIVEVEERPHTQKFTVGVGEGNKFFLKQEGIEVVTDFPIIINAEKGEISVLTPTGYRFISVLPKEAIEVLLRTKLITKISKTEKPLMTEGEHGQLIYKVSGEKVVNMFNLFNLEVPVKGEVSVLTGEVVSVEQPVWLRLFGFIFA